MGKIKVSIDIELDDKEPELIELLARHLDRQLGLDAFNLSESVLTSPDSFEKSLELSARIKEHEDERQRDREQSEESQCQDADDRTRTEEG